MSHYDCRDCGESLRTCECRKAREEERKAYWSSEALKRRHAIEKTRSAHERMKALMGPEAENTVCLGIVLQLAEAAVLQAERFAASD